MNKRKFDILFEAIIDELTPNVTEAQYQADCAKYQHEQPHRYKNTWIQIFIIHETMFDNEKYFAYLLGRGMKPVLKVKKIFTEKNYCRWHAQDVYDTKGETIVDQDLITFVKLERKYGKKPHTRNYGFYDIISEEKLTLPIDKFEELIQTLQNDDLVIQLKQSYNNYIDKKIPVETLINENYRSIDIIITEAEDLLPGRNKVVFRTVCPQTKLNWFNSVYRNALEKVNSSNVQK